MVQLEPMKIVRIDCLRRRNALANIFDGLRAEDINLLMQSPDSSVSEPCVTCCTRDVHLDKDISDEATDVQAMDPDLLDQAKESFGD